MIILMNLQQLCAAADNLHTSQPGVSKQVQLLEAELHAELFLRRGKRIVGMTPEGERVCHFAQQAIRDIEKIRYPYPSPIYAAWRGKKIYGPFPNTQLRLRQGNPTQIAELLASGDADMAIATEALNVHAGLAAIPCYQGNRVVIAPLID